MSGILLLWVGRRGTPPWDALAREYEGRLERFVPFSAVRVRPAAGRRGDPARALAEEAAAVRRHLSRDDVLAVLDEGGRERTTEALAAWLEEYRHPGRRLVLVIGSDLGLDAGLKKEAREIVSLSKLTLPHQLARVLLLEQLYRCFDLLAGGPYHRGGGARSEV